MCASRSKCCNVMCRWVCSLPEQVAERYWLYAGHEDVEMLKLLLLSSMHALNGLQPPLEHAAPPSLHAVYLQPSILLTHLCWLRYTARARQMCDVPHLMATATPNSQTRPLTSVKNQSRMDACLIVCMHAVSPLER